MKYSIKILLTLTVFVLTQLVAQMLPTPTFASCGNYRVMAGETFCFLTDTQSTIENYASCPADSQYDCCQTAAECSVPPEDDDDGGDDNEGGIPVFEGPDDEFFDSLNPLTNPELGGDPATGSQLTTPGGILSRVLDFALPLAGMILFVMLVWGGFEILVGSAGKKSMDAGKQRITAAIIGFTLLFVSYWIMQIIEIIFGIAIV